MKIYALFISLFLVAFQVSKPWKEFISVDGKFRVMAPEALEEKVNEIETAIGTISHFTYFYQDQNKDAENLIYKVSYVDYPEHTIHSDSLEFLEEFFHSTIETSIKSVHGTLRYSDEIQMDDYPGLIWRVDYNKGQATIKTKAYMVGRRFYQIQVIARSKKSLNPLQDRFFDSFYLISK